MRPRFVLLLLLLLVLLPGCRSSLARAVVKTPNHHLSFVEKLDPPAPPSVDAQFRVDVGPPAASLAVWVVEPDDSTNPRGTILVLHGLNNGRIWMLGKARDLADAGYRAVLVALRGQDLSSGQWRTFGVVEKRDLSQVIDALEQRNLIAGRIGVLGFSYGAAMAIQLAGHDARVDAVVAAAPFSSMRHVMPQYTQNMIPLVDMVVADTSYDRIIDEAGRVAGFNPDEADTVAAIAATHAPVLIAHGTKDRMVPVDNAHRIYANAKPGDELYLMENFGHVTLWMDYKHRLAARTLQWFDAHLVN
jgi:hypothetical protein